MSVFEGFELIVVASCVGGILVFAILFITTKWLKPKCSQCRENGSGGNGSSARVTSYSLCYRVRLWWFQRRYQHLRDESTQEPPSYDAESVSPPTYEQTVTIINSDITQGQTPNDPDTHILDSPVPMETIDAVSHDVIAQDSNADGDSLGVNSCDNSIETGNSPDSIFNVNAATMQTAAALQAVVNVNRTIVSEDADDIELIDPCADGIPLTEAPPPYSN